MPFLSLMEVPVHPSRRESVSLEFLLARDITPLLSRSKPDLPYAKATSENPLVAPSPSTGMLIPEELLPEDIDIGIMGMTIDPNTGHVWWSNNHTSRYIHELDSLFQQVHAHEPRKPESDPLFKAFSRDEYTSVSDNFRDIFFVREGTQYTGMILDTSGGVRIIEQQEHFTSLICLAFNTNEQYPYALLLSMLFLTKICFCFVIQILLARKEPQ